LAFNPSPDYAPEGCGRGAEIIERSARLDGTSRVGCGIDVSHDRSIWEI
jgi:hypothetical protein